MPSAFTCIVTVLYPVRFIAVKWVNSAKLEGMYPKLSLHTSLVSVQSSGKFVTVILPVIFVGFYVRGIVGMLEIRKSGEGNKGI